MENYDVLIYNFDFVLKEYIKEPKQSCCIFSVNIYYLDFEQKKTLQAEENRVVVMKDLPLFVFNLYFRFSIFAKVQFLSLIRLIHLVCNKNNNNHT